MDMNLKRLLFILGVISSGMVSAATFDADTFQTRKKENVIITFIGHGSLMLSYNNQTIQIDPVARYADYSTFPKADAILITHEHGDHLDAKTIETLSKKETLLIVNDASGKKLGKGSVMNNGEKKTILDHVTLEAVAAYNSTLGREAFLSSPSQWQWVCANTRWIARLHRRRYRRYSGNERAEVN